MKSQDLRIMKDDLREDRVSLKNNFVDRITVRIDYKNVFDVREIFSEVEDYMIKIGFADFQEGFLNEASVNLNDPDIKKSIEEERSIPLSKLKKSESIRFYNDDGNYLELTNAFILLKIFPSDYVKFDTYIKWVLDTMDIIKDKIPNLKLLRVGLRKVNMLFMYNIEKMYDYYKMFNIDNYKLYDKVLDMDSIYGSHSINYYNMNGYRINYIQNLAFGEDDDKKQIYRFITDYDGYIRNTERNLSIDDLEQNFIDINTILFYFYKQTLNPEFFSKLKKDDFKDSNLRGVKRNEKL